MGTRSCKTHCVCMDRHFGMMGTQHLCAYSAKRILHKGKSIGDSIITTYSCLFHDLRSRNDYLLWYSYTATSHYAFARRMHWKWWLLPSKPLNLVSMSFKAIERLWVVSMLGRLLKIFEYLWMAWMSWRPLNAVSVFWMPLNVFGCSVYALNIFKCNVYVFEWLESFRKPLNVFECSIYAFNIFEYLWIPLNTWMPLNAFNCLWMKSTSLECLWSPLNAFECLWVSLKSLECLWSPLNEVDIFWMPLNAFECLWSPLNAFEVLWTK